MNGIIVGVTHRLLYYVFIEVDFEKIKNAIDIHISTKEVDLGRKIRHTAITSHHIVYYYYYYYLRGNDGDDVILVQCPFKITLLARWAVSMTVGICWKIMLCMQGASPINCM